MRGVTRLCAPLKMFSLTRMFNCGIGMEMSGGHLRLKTPTGHPNELLMKSWRCLQEIAQPLSWSDIHWEDVLWLAFLPD